MYSTAGWDNFFVAEAGASAALLGLLFVAVSINLSKVLSYPHLPGRAGEALIVLTGVLLAATCGLIPGQSHEWLGIELVVLGAIAWLVPIPAQVRHARAAETRAPWVIYRVLSTQAATVPTIVAGVSLYFERGGGLYWLVPAVVCSFGNAIVGGWVLLIEIQR